MKRLLPLIALLASTGTLAGETEIRNALSGAYPQIPIKSIQPSAIPGLYEVFAGGKLVYADPTGSYLVIGSIFDIKTKSNLTQERLETLTAMKFDELPLDKAIKVVHGDGSRKLAVFTDPDCPYCKRLEQELARVDNVTVYVFMTPFTEIHPEARAHAEAIWCSKDRSESWRQFMLEGKSPADGTKCDTPVSDVLAFAQEHDISATPTLLFASGKRISGGVPADQIEEQLK